MPVHDDIRSASKLALRAISRDEIQIAIPCFAGTGSKTARDDGENGGTFFRRARLRAP